jgi:hypothetical protein
MYWCEMRFNQILIFVKINEAHTYICNLALVWISHIWSSMVLSLYLSVPKSHFKLLMSTLVWCWTTKGWNTEHLDWVFQNVIQCTGYKQDVIFLIKITQCISDGSIRKTSFLIMKYIFSNEFALELANKIKHSASINWAPQWESL